MEKRRFCRYGFIGVLAAFAVLSSVANLKAQGQIESVVEVQVSVEEPVKQGDSAGSLEAARQAAFKLAIERALPPGISEEDKKQRLANAASYIKTFRTLSQIEEAGTIKLSLLCQVVQSVSSGSAPAAPLTSSYTSRAVSLEMVWRPGTKAYLASEVKRIMEDEVRIPVRAIQVQYGSVVVQLGTDEPESSLLAKIGPKFQDRALLKILNASPSPENQGWMPNP